MARPGISVRPLLALASAALLAGCGGGLGVGDPAPPLKVGKWLKGEPVAAFKPGTTYVVECWASWCPPCRATIPHLTALQKKHPSVVFIGVNVSEPPAAGEAFVRQMGDRMDYRVALDAPGEGSVAAGWLRASGQKGIPCAFVVDGEGKIAWIGHPMNPAMVQAIGGS
jgi:thiol-disulfide isomerase/thioredoxin